jgi:hypothetical protein
MSVCCHLVALNNLVYNELSEMDIIPKFMFIYPFILCIFDKTQTSHAIRRNYPVIGRLRYKCEELPFNRALRSWVCRSAKDIDSTIALGSTRDVKKFGSIYFTNSMYPLLQDESPGSENY